MFLAIVMPMMEVWDAGHMAYGGFLVLNGR
jgi:hypothetical protein